MESSDTKSVLIFDSGSYSSELSQPPDAELRTDDGCTFRVHREKLARRSNYFDAMFYGMGRDRREFTIPDLSGDCLSHILCYIYTGYLRVTERNLTDLMIAADYLGLKDLYKEIKQNIKTNMTEVNCLRILHAAYDISDEDIVQKCFRFIQTRFEWIVRCRKNGLADLPLKILRLILSNRSLYVYNETPVWQAIVQWTMKVSPFRLFCVPQLLLTLAIEDMEEELATKILQHEIISKNPLIRNLIESRPLNAFTSNLDVILSIMRSYSDSFTVPYTRRIPPSLNVLSYNTDEDNSNLYITYDENPDLWRQITPVGFQPDFLIAIGHNIYIFKFDKKNCMNFDLSVMNWVKMESFWCFNCYDLFVVAIDGYIYVLGKISRIHRHWTVEVYDTANISHHGWSYGVCLPEIDHGAAVAFEKKIYVVGITWPPNGGIKLHMFDPVTQRWSHLSSPIFYHYNFALVAYHQKIYLLGEDTSKAEVFDPAYNFWKVIQNLPHKYSTIRTVVFNDQFIVYEGGYKRKLNTKNVRWNDAMECWEKLDESDALKDLYLYTFCTINDVDTIRMITKQNRNPNTKLMRSPFN